MIFDSDLFKELDTTIIFKVQVGNGEYLPAEGKGTVEIKAASEMRRKKDLLG